MRKKSSSAIMDMKPNPGKGIATYTLAMRRLSILACRPNMVSKVEKEELKKQAEGNEGYSNLQESSTIGSRHCKSTNR